MKNKFLLFLSHSVVLPCSSQHISRQTWYSCLHIKVQFFCLYFAVSTQRGFPCTRHSPNYQIWIRLAVENRAIFLGGKVTLLCHSVVKRSGFWPEHWDVSVAAHWLLLATKDFREGSTNPVARCQYTSLVNLLCDTGKKALHIPGAPTLCSGNLINDTHRLLKTWLYYVWWCWLCRCTVGLRCSHAAATHC